MPLRCAFATKHRFLITQQIISKTPLTDELVAFSIAFA
jgi:hypothetical protein